MNREMEKYLATGELHVVPAMEQIDQGAKGILFVVDHEKRLVGCVTDGDIRRWLIKTADLTGMISQIMYTRPKYVLEHDTVDYEAYMERNAISAVPVLDQEKHIVDIIFRHGGNTVVDAKKKLLADVPVIIMAGGKGTRLYPYTKILPKPLIPIGDIPIIERIMNEYVEYGARDFYLTVNYKKGMIKSYFDDIQPDYRITYVNEEKPLGTGGSISLIGKQFDVPVIVANCDSLIKTDLADIYLQHQKSGNKITVVSSLKNVVIPYGVIRVKQQGIIESMEEKPRHSYLINTGMYVVDPDMLDLIPKDTFYHMTDLIEDAMKQEFQVGVYPVSEDSFLDMGEFAEMKRMEEKLKV